MFVCALTLHVRLEKKTDFLHKLSDEIAPLLTRSPGALEFLVLQDDIELDRFSFSPCGRLEKRSSGIVPPA